MRDRGDRRVRTRRRRSTRWRCGAWPRRCATAGPTASASRSTPAPGSSRRGSRSSTSRAAGSRSRRRTGEAASSTTARSTTTPSCAPSWSPRRGASTPRATPRSCCACSSATASQRSTASTASSRSPGGSPRRRRLTLVRDRFGVRPLHYALLDDGTLVFGSEAKALFASGEVDAAPDPAGIDEVFTLWGPRAAADGVRRRQPAPAGRAARLGARADRRGSGRGGTPEYGDGRGAERGSGGAAARQRPAAPSRRRPGGHLPLRRARLQPDHRTRPAGDRPRASARSRSPSRIRATTSAPTRRRSRAGSGTHHHVVEIGPAEIADAFPDVVRHAETPLMRTAPVPLYLLAREVRDQGITVVATGEGADELFWGYELFKEVAAARAQPLGPEPRGQRCLTSSTPPRRGRGPTRPRLAPLPPRDRARTTAFSAPTSPARRPTAPSRRFYRPEVAAERRPRPLERLRGRAPGAFAGWTRWSAPRGSS